MRLLIYYKPNIDKFVINYNQDRQHELPIGSVNCYGHIIIQYWYIEDKKVFYYYSKYRRYLDHKYKRNKPSLRYRIGQQIIKFGKRVSFGKEEKVKVIYIDRYKYPWWK